VLDQLADPDSELSTRHLTHEELEAYANGRLGAARLDHCRNHLDSCDACRAELEDLRALKSELSAFTRAEPNRSELKRRKRRKLALPWVASGVALLGLVVCAVLWWGHRSPRVTPIAAAAPAVRSVPAVRSAPAAPPAVAVSTQTHDTQPAREAPAPPIDEKPPVAKAHTTFALLSPLGETISDTRPELSWEPLPGAVRYSVVIVDAGLHRVQRSRALRDTSWRPKRPLRRGRTYLWQVTATLRGGSKVVASAPGTLTLSAKDGS
jgi:hypothetical protein